MPISLAQIRDLLLPGLYAVTGEYPQLPRVWSQVYKTRKSNMALERLASMRYLPIAAIKQEGGTTSADNASGERYIYNQEHDEIGLMFAITRKAIDDNLYKTEFGPNAMGLRNAFLRFEEVRGADVINSATTYNARSAATARRWRRPTIRWMAARSPTSQARRSRSTRPRCSAQVSINADFRDNANQRMNAKPRRLLIPPQLEPTAIRLLKTELRPGTANNDVNAILSTQGGIPDGYLVWNYLTSAVRLAGAHRSGRPHSLRPRALRVGHVGRVHDRQPAGQGLHARLVRLQRSALRLLLAAIELREGTHMGVPTNFPDGLGIGGAPVIPGGGDLPLAGRYFYVDSVAGLGWLRGVVGFSLRHSRLRHWALHGEQGRHHRPQAGSCRNRHCGERHHR
jgi:hypothetical protein